MPNSKIFCNVPWFELNINHDGSYDLCGCQNDKIAGTAMGQIWNIKKIPIDQYWNSERLRKSRMIKLGDVPDPMCRMCQDKDSIGYDSNRVKENMKSVIFSGNFDRSYSQSPHQHYFEHSRTNQGQTLSKIRSLHVNLGHVCNFSCRMCNPIYSSRLQNEYRQLQWIAQDKTFDHWTDDDTAWANFTNFLDANADDIKVIHIIGGEVGFMPKFDYLIDFFIDRGLAETVNISFTTNGSVDYTRYFERLSVYRRCEIGISIESVDPIGDYIRQGGDIEEILRNINKFKHNATPNMAFTIRTVPSLLSLPSYANLIEYAWRLAIPIDNSLLVNPSWQRAVLLPDYLKQRIYDRLQDTLSKLPNTPDQYNNQKDPNRIDISIKKECNSLSNLMLKPAPDDAERHRRDCARHLDQWDRLKDINLKDYDRDLYDFLVEYGYHGA